MLYYVRAWNLRQYPPSNSLVYQSFWIVHCSPWPLHPCETLFTAVKPFHLHTRQTPIRIKLNLSWLCCPWPKYFYSLNIIIQCLIIILWEFWNIYLIGPLDSVLIRLFLPLYTRVEVHSLSFLSVCLIKVWSTANHSYNSVITAHSLISCQYITSVMVDKTLNLIRWSRIANLLEMRRTEHHGAIFTTWLIPSIF
jgi:hypothetical protein